MMAGGWSRDGAVQDQIDASVEDGINRVRSKLSEGKSLKRCEECDAKIPVARQKAVAGVRLCIECQQQQDQQSVSSGINRRGSKDSQLR
jgi:RNA polymerase-binding transcription factor DksA